MIELAAIALGLGSLPGVALGALIAESLPEDVLRRLFALLVLAIAAQIAWRARAG